MASRAAIRFSSGGWLEKAACMRPALMAKALISSGMGGVSWAACRAFNALIMLRRPASSAPPLSARNSRQRENHMTIIMAAMPNTNWAIIETIQNAGPWPRSTLNTRRSTR
tara:strand:- start:311 stop:643 length:333 start_codon:yes stop_codon:yes gene_type:complete